MTKNQIKKRYNKLVSGIETMNMYDGRNTVDRYECEACGAMIHTTYKDKGVTPFVINCHKCNGAMRHTKTFEKATVPPFVKVLNWYRPTLKKVLKMPEEMIEHILNGGLVLEQLPTNNAKRSI